MKTQIWNKKENRPATRKELTNILTKEGLYSEQGDVSLKFVYGLREVEKGIMTLSIDKVIEEVYEIRGSSKMSVSRIDNNNYASYQELDYIVGGNLQGNPRQLIVTFSEDGNIEFSLDTLGKGEYKINEVK